MARVDELRGLVEKDPGRPASSYTHQLGWGRGSAQAILANAEAAGVLFWEDDLGMIYPFEGLTPEQAAALNEVFDPPVRRHVDKFWKGYLSRREVNLE